MASLNQLKNRAKRDDFHLFIILLKLKAAAANSVEFQTNASTIRLAKEEVRNKNIDSNIQNTRDFLLSALKIYFK